MIHFSSGGLYDRSTSVILNESTPLARPEVLDFYLRSKLIADQVLELAESSMVDLTIVRPFFVFGSQMPSSRLFSRLISSLRHGSPVHLRNPDGIRINPCYVGDISEGVLRLLQRRSLRAVNFSGSDVLTLGEICRLFSDYLGCEYHFVSNSDPEDDCVSDTSMFSQLLGRSPRGLGDRELLNGLLA